MSKNNILIGSDEDNNNLKQIMSQFTDEPYVGIFWYDAINNKLIDVVKIPMSQSGKYGTVTKLHKNIWAKNAMRAIAKKEKNSLYYEDYTQIPRGRIFYRNGGYEVMVGSWINLVADKLRMLIEDEFDLIDFKFVINEHWELGHEWSEHEF